jgi:tryptophan 2,3-dioxygenase
MRRARCTAGKQATANPTQLLSPLTDTNRSDPNCPIPPGRLRPRWRRAQILGAQAPRSAEAHPAGQAHDEHLFIVIHQTYELWFKQILHEINSVVDVFSSPYVDEGNVGIAVKRLQRVTEIQRILVSQLSVLETMSPMGFLEFRDFLFPASGFQSVQFRLLENTLGLTEKMRLNYGRRHYCTYLNADHAETVQECERRESLHDLVEKWLERTPFLTNGNFSFWAHYRRVVDEMLDSDRQFIRRNELLNDEQRKEMLEDVDARAARYEDIYNEDIYNEHLARGDHRLSHKAMQAALLISLYGDEPILQPASALLDLLLDIDQLLTQWRHRHALMVHRMLGIKIGTGGSSGYHYLRATASQHRIFTDLFNVATFLVPKDSLPPLPSDIERMMKFRYDEPSSSGAAPVAQFAAAQAEVPAAVGMPAAVALLKIDQGAAGTAAAAGAAEAPAVPGSAAAPISALRQPTPPRERNKIRPLDA